MGRIGAAGLSRLLGTTWRARGVTYLALSDALRLLVLDGRLALECRLPSERELAVALGISRTTVSAAYNRLREQQFLLSRQGAGSWTTTPVATGGVAPDSPTLHPPARGELPPDTIDLSTAALGAGPEVHAAFVAAMTMLPRYLPGTGYELIGRPELREVIAARYTERGVATSADDIMITYGAQHSIALVLGALVDPGDRVLIEHPTYPNALEAVRRVGGRPVPINVAGGMTAGGMSTAGMVGSGMWDLDAVAATIRQASPVAGYVVPDFHNPTGACASAAEREQLVRDAAAHRMVLVVDESLADLWLDRPPPPSMACFASDIHDVVAVGGVSKTFWGGLRVGWIRAERSLLRRVAAARAASDLGNPIVDQLAASHLLTSPAAAAELAGRRAGVAAMLLDTEGALRRHLPTWRWHRPAGGLAMWIEIGAPLSSVMAALAPAHGLRLAGGPLFGLDGAFERNIRLPLIAGGELADEVGRRLALVWSASQGMAPPALRGWQVRPVA